MYGTDMKSLKWQTSGIGLPRVDEVLDIVGLTDVAGQPAGSFSLGMGQRLGIASALLGDPSAVMLAEQIRSAHAEADLLATSRC